MNRKLTSIFSIIFILLLESHLILNAEVAITQKFNFMEAEIPLKVLIQNGNTPSAQILNVEDEIKPGCKLIYPKQLIAFMYDPSNPNVPVEMIDIKKTLLKFVLQNPDLSKKSGITLKDFKDAGISDEDLKAIFLEPLTTPEITFLSKLLGDFIEGDTSLGGKYCLKGIWDIVKGTSKIGMGASILIKKACIAIVHFAHKLCIETYNVCNQENAPNNQKE